MVPWVGPGFLVDAARVAARLAHDCGAYLQGRPRDFSAPDPVVLHFERGREQVKIAYHLCIFGSDSHDGRILGRARLTSLNGVNGGAISGVCLPLGLMCLVFGSAPGHVGREVPSCIRPLLGILPKPLNNDCSSQWQGGGFVSH